MCDYVPFQLLSYYDLHFFWVKFFCEASSMPAVHNTIWGAPVSMVFAFVCIAELLRYILSFIFDFGGSVYDILIHLFYAMNNGKKNCK